MGHLIPPMPDTQTLDPAAIESLRSLSPDTDGSFLRELVEIYLQDTPLRLTELETALVRGDAPALMRAAHTIKGSSSNFGATRFAQLAQEIERLAKAANCPAAAPLLPELKSEYALVVQALKEIAACP
jgi:HPt (histidine-containing phosphotransfer) domain-containing protein